MHVEDGPTRTTGFPLYHIPSPNSQKPGGDQEVQPHHLRALNTLRYSRVCGPFFGFRRLRVGLLRDSRGVGSWVYRVYSVGLWVKKDLPVT